MAMLSSNPATGETLQTVTPHTPGDVDRILDRAVLAFDTHRGTSLEERAACLRRAADILDSEKREFGRLMTLEMGKPIGAAVAEAEKCAWACRYYADNAAAFLADEHVDTDAADSFIRYQPLGVVLAVMPWNFPFWQVLPLSPPGTHGRQCRAAQACVQRAAVRAGHRGPAAPGQASRQARSRRCSSGQRRRSIHHRDRACTRRHPDRQRGRRLCRGGTAGRALKKTVLELGGSDPFIVMASADLDSAVRTAVTARTINNGQSCIAAKRFIVEDGIYDAFEAKFVAGMRALRVGDPMDEATEIGPLATRSHPRRAARAGAGIRQRRRTAAVRRDHAGRAGLVLSTHRPHRHPGGLSGLGRGVVRAGGVIVPRARHRRGHPPGQ
jgi:succinate-semialdehyde dehydrogenase / glutarate-semialdehyde dehydrogenase